MPLPVCSGLKADIQPKANDTDPDRSVSCDIWLILTTESLILAQNERWRRGLGMQVERESILRIASTVANG